MFQVSRHADHGVGSIQMDVIGAQVKSGRESLRASLGATGTHAARVPAVQRIARRIRFHSCCRQGFCMDMTGDAYLDLLLPAKEGPAA